MRKLEEKMVRFFDKLTLIIKNWILPCCIILILSAIAKQLFGYGLLSFELEQVLGLDGVEHELVMLLAMYVIVWKAYDIFIKHLVINIEPRGEYREKHGDDGEDSGTDQSKKNAHDAKENIEQERTDKKDLLMQYHEEILKINTTRAMYSFWALIICGIVGIGVIVYAVYSTNASVSTISAISGAILELSSGTALLVSKRADKELKNCYELAHDDEKIKKAVNMAGELSPEKKEEMLVEIIHKLIDSISQNNKTENIKKNAKKRKRAKKNN